MPEVTLLQNTLCLALATSTVAVPIGTLLAWCLHRYRIPFRGICHTCLIVLLFLPLYIQLAGWEAGFGRGGWYSLLIANKLTDPPLEGFRGAVLVHSFAAIPWVYWFLRMGFAAIPQHLEEVASLDASKWQVFRRIIAPLSLASFVGATLYVIITTGTEITITDLYQVRTVAEELYNELVLSTSLATLPNAVWPIVVSVVVFSAAGLAWCRYVSPTLVHARTVVRQPASRSSNGLANTFVLIVVTTLVLVPLGNLVYQAGIQVELNGNDRVRVWSISKLGKIVSSSPWTYNKELAWTAVSSQISSLVTIACATICVWWSHGSQLRTAFLACVGVLCFVTPGPVIGFTLIWLLNGQSTLMNWLYDETIFAPCLAMAIRCYPYALLILGFAMRSIPRSILETSRLDGATRGQTFFRVVLPLLRPALWTTLLVCLAVCVGELSASVLVQPPGVFTVASRAFNLIHYGAEDELAGLSLCCVSLMTLLALLAQYSIPRADSLDT